MLDQSPRKIKEYSEVDDFEHWQLRTPLTNYKLAGVDYGLDNGAFTRFNEKAWVRLVKQAKDHKPVFVCLPDIVGSARRTLELFPHFLKITSGLPRALVLQDGIGDFSIPWNDIEAVFIGGTDDFKISSEAFAAAKTARCLNKWVHVGRVNTEKRVNEWWGVADSIDGSGISRYDHMRKRVVTTIKNNLNDEIPDWLRQEST